MPTSVTDPSGQGWVYAQPGSLDYQYEQAIANGLNVFHGMSPSFPPEFEVPVSYDGAHCNRRTASYTINVVDRNSQQLWDIEHLQAFISQPAAVLTGIQRHLVL